MKIDKPKNPNYCATIVELMTFNKFDNCDNVQGTIIFGNQIIVSTDSKKGDVGLYFPLETKLSKEFLSNNNLYRKPEFNSDQTKKGYFEENGRIRCVKFRGHNSEGFFIPLNSLEFVLKDRLNEIKLGMEFDTINDIGICEKYIPKTNQRKVNNQYNIKKKPKKAILEDQFRFHEDTLQFAKNAYRISEDDIVSISYKMHGTSVVISKILCYKELNLFYKILKLFGIKIIDSEYKTIYSSRKVIKNLNQRLNAWELFIESFKIIKDNFHKTTIRKLINKILGFIKVELNRQKNHFYDIDIWGKANEKISPYLQDGMTIYAEIVGYIPESGKEIQKGYDYGCERSFEVYVYRITYTNTHGKIFEFSFKQVSDWCKKMGLKVVPELFYNKIYMIFDWKDDAYSEYYDDSIPFDENLINVLKLKFLEKDCHMCKNKVPAEGIVIRPERLDFEAYKLKSFRFLKRETDLLDAGEDDIEEIQEEPENQI